MATGEPSATVPPAPPVGDPPAGCLGLDAPGCRVIVPAVLAALPAGHPRVIYVQAGPFYCQNEGCPPGLVARPKGEATVEFEEAPAVSFDVTAAGDRITVTARQQSFLFAVAPSSRRLGQPVTPYSLAHCGLFSGIDVDGSFWDPVGLVDADHPAAINSADGTFALTSPLTARFATPTGFALDLVRHPGQKSLPGCM